MLQHTRYKDDKDQESDEPAGLTSRLPAPTWLPVGASVVVDYTVEVNLPVAQVTTFTNKVTSPTIGSNCPSGGLDPLCFKTIAVAAQTLTLSGLTPNFTLSGPPNTTVSQNGATTMTVTTNVPGGYLVTVRSSASGLVGTGGNTDTIPIGRLGVRETGSTLFGAVSTDSVTVHEQNVPSAPAGDAISNDYQIEIPFVAPDTYSATLEYIVTAQ